MYLLLLRSLELFDAGPRGARLAAELFALLGSSLFFGLFHLEYFTGWIGAGGEPFDAGIFTWRVLAGILLAILFRLRGRRRRRLDPRLVQPRAPDRHRDPTCSYESLLRRPDGRQRARVRGGPDPSAVRGGARCRPFGDGGGLQGAAPRARRRAGLAGERLAEALPAWLGAQAARVRAFASESIEAPPSSGTALTGGAILCPCSMGTLARVAAGFSSNLVERAADVALKEGRPLILVVREAPYSAIHLENMLRLARWAR
jgi:hypothetical protein